MKVSFQFKLFISLVAFFSVLFALLGVYYYFDASHQLYQEMSARAKIQAEEIALMPDLRQQVAREAQPGFPLLACRLLPVELRTDKGPGIVRVRD